MVLVENAQRLGYADRWRVELDPRPAALERRPDEDLAALLKVGTARAVGVQIRPQGVRIDHDMPHGVWHPLVSIHAFLFSSPESGRSPPARFFRTRSMYLM